MIVPDAGIADQGGSNGHDVCALRCIERSQAMPKIQRIAPVYGSTIRRSRPRVPSVRTPNCCFHVLLVSRESSTWCFRPWSLEYRVCGHIRAFQIFDPSSARSMRCVKSGEPRVAVFWRFFTARALDTASPAYVGHDRCRSPRRPAPKSLGQYLNSCSPVFR